MGSSVSCASPSRTTSSACCATSTPRSSSSPFREDADDDPLTVLLELLHDVPAGKLAVAELRDATPDDVAELERSGVDAVLVWHTRFPELIQAGPPEV